MKSKRQKNKLVQTFYVQKRLYEHLKQKETARSLDYFLYVLDRINRQMFTQKDLGYAFLSSTLLQEIMNWRNYTLVIDNLTWGKIIERSAGYGPGRCYGYRIADGWAADECIFVVSAKKLAVSSADECYQNLRDGVLPTALHSVAHQLENLKMLSIDYSLASKHINHWYSTFTTTLTEQGIALAEYHNSSSPDYIHDWDYYYSDTIEENRKDTKEEKKEENREDDTLYVTTIDNYNYNKYNHDRLWIDSFLSKEYTFSRDTQGRLYTTMTSCPKRLRPFLTLSGIDQLCIVDVRNCQPLLINILLEGSILGHIKDAKEYKLATERGDLYDQLMEQLGLHSMKRPEFKIDYLKHFLYAKNPYPSDISDVFRSLYPTVWEFVMSYKKPSLYAQLPKEMQKEEARIMIDSVSVRLADEHIWHLTIHDAVLCSSADSVRVSRIMQEEFQKMGLRATVDSQLVVRNK